MNNENEFFIWEEKNSIDQKKNLLTKEENVNLSITTEIKKDLTKNVANDTTKVSGIYKIINKVNGKYYVGSTKNIILRWGKHKSKLKHKSHFNSYLQNAWNKYGENNFNWVLVEKIPIEFLLMTEQKYLDIAKTEQDKCYNIRFFVDYIEMTNDIRMKISNSLKGSKNPNYGKPRSEETKRKSSNSQMGSRNHYFDHTIYTFQNIKTQEKFTGTRSDFRIKYKIDDTNISCLIHGKRKHTQSWVIENHLS